MNTDTQTPAEIAKKLFSDVPGDKCSKIIIPYDANNEIDTDDACDIISFNFEILLTIYFEGIIYILNLLLNEPSNKKTEYEIYKNFTLNEFQFLEPWFNSFGFSVSVSEYKSDSKSKQFVNNQLKPAMYCRTLLSFDPKDKPMFFIKSITEKYHFILNSSYKKTNNYNNIFTILSKDDKFYKISFTDIRLNT